VERIGKKSFEQDVKTEEIPEKTLRKIEN